MMNATVKRKWVEALRSGRFRQGIGFLKTDDLIMDPNDPLDVPPTPVQTYCCLGVLCELAAEEGVLPGPGANTPDDRRYHYGAEHDRRWSDLPRAVQDWAGTNHDPVVPGHGRLSTLNDNGADFEYIANLIESYL